MHLSLEGGLAATGLAAGQDQNPVSETVEENVELVAFIGELDKTLIAVIFKQRQRAI